MSSFYKILPIAIILSIASIFAGCAPTSSQLKKAIENDPSIVFSAIEKDPQGFIEIVNKAAKSAQANGAEKAAKDEVAKREEEFKNPVKPEVQEERVIWGKKDARVTIVEYSDFECPYCQRGAEAIDQVLKAYPNDVRVLLKHLPLDFHPKALPAAKYFEAVAKQNQALSKKFHDEIFRNQNDLKAKGEDFLKSTAKKLGVDMAKLNRDLSDEKIATRISSDTAEAQKFGFSGTPGFLINGVSLRGAYPFSEFKKIIDQHLAK